MRCCHVRNNIGIGNEHCYAVIRDGGDVATGIWVDRYRGCGSIIYRLRADCPIATTCSIEVNGIGLDVRGAVGCAASI